jgi:ribose 5-phosphate isomerase
MDIETVQPSVRPAADIHEDIAGLIRSYPPLVQSRHQFMVEIADGVVTVRGYIKSIIAERVLQDNLPRIPGVVAVDLDALYNDESMRMALGKVVPAGALITVDYGVVIVSGHLPQGLTEEKLTAQIEQVPGVRRVVFQTW